MGKKRTLDSRIACVLFNFVLNHMCAGMRVTVCVCGCVEYISSNDSSTLMMPSTNQFYRVKVKPFYNSMNHHCHHQRQRIAFEYSMHRIDCIIYSRTCDCVRTLCDWVRSGGHMHRCTQKRLTVTGSTCHLQLNKKLHILNEQPYINDEVKNRHTFTYLHMRARV